MLYISAPLTAAEQQGFLDLQDSTKDLQRVDNIDWSHSQEKKVDDRSTKTKLGDLANDASVALYSGFKGTRNAAESTRQAARKVKDIFKGDR